VPSESVLRALDDEIERLVHARTFLFPNAPVLGLRKPKTKHRDEAATKVAPDATSKPERKKAVWTEEKRKAVGLSTKRRWARVKRAAKAAGVKVPSRLVNPDKLTKATAA
jgi:hypothetical protein